MDTTKSLLVNGLLVFLLVLGGVSATTAEPDATQKQSFAVNINTADAETLAATLKGVGQKRAAEIVAWRNSNGQFTSLDQLMEIKGIGPKFLTSNRQLLKLEE